MVKNKTKYLLDLLLIICLTVISMLLLPYQFGIEDQIIYIPVIEKSLNPALFSTDYLLNSHGETTLFFPIVKHITLLFNNMQTAFMFSYFVTLLLFFIGVYLLSYSLFQNRIVAIVTVLLFLFPKWIGGTGTKTYENYFLPRFFSTPLIIFSLIFLTKNKLLIGSLLTAITFLIHPISGTTLSIILFIFILFIDKKTKLHIKVVSLCLLFIAPLLIYFLAKNQTIEMSKYLIMPKEWLDLAKLRDPFVFPQLWKIRSFGSLLIFCLFYFLFILRGFVKSKANPVNKDHLQLINLISIICLFLPLITLVLSTILPITLLIQLELARSLTVFSYISLLCLSYYGLYIYKSSLNKLFKIPVMLIIALSIFWNNNKYQKINKDFIEIQKWSRNNTSVDSVFLTDPYNKGFRVFSQRTIIGEYKDGGPLLFSYKYALEWDARIKKINRFKEFTENDFLDINKEYPFNYLIVSKNIKLKFNKIHENQSYSIYKLN